MKTRIKKRMYERRVLEVAGTSVLYATSIHHNRRYGTWMLRYHSRLAELISVEKGEDYGGSYGTHWFFHRNLVTCDRNLVTCDRNLVTCDRNLLTCDRNLVTCDRNLITCDRNLVACDRNLVTCDRNLVTCDRNLLERLTCRYRKTT